MEPRPAGPGPAHLRPLTLTRPAPVTTSSAGDHRPPPASVPNTQADTVPALSVGTYRIMAGGTDDQQPHGEDEIYVVQAGRARLVAG